MLNETLKLLRQFYRLNQTDLASMLGVHKSFISEIESGKRDISYKLLEKYSSVFKMPISSIELLKDKLENKDEETFISKKIIEIFKWFASTECALSFSEPVTEVETERALDFNKPLVEVEKEETHQADVRVA